MAILKCCNTKIKMLQRILGFRECRGLLEKDVTEIHTKKRIFPHRLI